MKSQLPAIYTIISLLCFTMGCGGDGFDRVAVSGKVSCEGIATPNGGIVATPAQAGTGAPNVFAVVTDGTFGFPAERGPTAGSYIFEFSFEDPKKAPAERVVNEDGEREGGPTITYRKTVEIPEQGADGLSIDLTPADLVREKAVY